MKTEIKQNGSPLLAEKVKEYGIRKLSYELDLCELSIRNKVTGKTRISPSELALIRILLNLTDDEVEVIKEELNA